MKKFIKLIKDKWLRQASLTLLLVALIVAFYVALNLVMDKLDISPIDFTNEKIYTLSDESKNAVKDVEQNVTIYFFGYKEESKEVVLAKQYHDVNEKIEVKMITAQERPDLAAMYGVTNDSDMLIAIASSQRYKALPASDMYTYDMNSGEEIDLTEQKLTNGILDVTISSKPQIYFLTGHREDSIGEEGSLSYVAQYIVNEVNDVFELDLLSSDMPEKCDVLVIANPKVDFTDLEVQKIEKYINNGGNILWMQDPYVAINTSNEKLSNVNKVLSMYGIKFSSGVVYERSTDNMLLNSPEIIIPNLTYNDIVKDIHSDGKIVLIDSGKIDNESSEKMTELNVTSETFIETTDKAYYVENFITYEKKAEGTFILGEVLTKKVNDDKSSKLVAISNAYFASNTYIPLEEGYLIPVTLRNNRDIVLNSVAYLSNREDSIRIRKDTGLVTFEAPTETQNIIVKVIIFGIPVLIILAGIVISIIRRRK